MPSHPAPLPRGVGGADGGAPRGIGTGVAAPGAAVTGGVAVGGRAAAGTAASAVASTEAAIRKPLSALRLPGSLRYRAADRANFASLSHDPPRSTRRGRSPVGWVRSGSVTGPGR